MKNREKYKDKILASIKDGTLVLFFEKYVNPWFRTESRRSMDCAVLFALWLDEEYEESEVDWTKVEMDTKILVSNDGKAWYRRYFSTYGNERIYAFCEGHPKWTSFGSESWKYAKLAEEEK